MSPDDILTWAMACLMLLAVLALLVAWRSVSSADKSHAEALRESARARRAEAAYDVLRRQLEQRAAAPRNNAFRTGFDEHARRALTLVDPDATRELRLGDAT